MWINYFLKSQSLKVDSSWPKHPEKLTDMPTHFSSWSFYQFFWEDEKAPCSVLRMMPMGGEVTEKICTLEVIWAISPAMCINFQGFWVALWVHFALVKYWGTKESLKEDQSSESSSVFFKQCWTHCPSEGSKLLSYSLLSGNNFAELRSVTLIHSETVFEVTPQTSINLH